MTFGEKLQKLRTRAGLSQDQLAKLLDVSRQAVSKWEPPNWRLMRTSFSLSLIHISEPTRRS